VVGVAAQAVDQSVEGRFERDGVAAGLGEHQAALNGGEQCEGETFLSSAFAHTMLA
jgi:hypothetical protein